MQSDKNNLLEISKAEANKWIRYGLKKNEEEEVNNLLLEGNEDILMESFHKKLEFGTGGMRGLIGIGSNRINSYTISLATQGLCNYLNKVIDGKASFGFNAATSEFGDMIEMGILDPAKVTRTALQAAGSVAGMMITTEAMVTDVPKDDTPMPPMPDMGGMGGMGGMM